MLLHGFARAAAPALLDERARIAAPVPFRPMITPSGHRMAAAMTNGGALGWVSDRTAYRYVACDSETGQPWPPMPARLL